VEPDAAERAALSASWEDRAHAARVLAERPESSDLVDRLLLDPDLAVAASAAEGLLTRADEQAVEQFTSAYVRAEDQRGDHFNDVLRVAVQRNPDILRTLERLSEDSDLGARMTLAWLADTYEPAEQSRLMRTAMHARWRRCRRSTVNQTASLRRQATTARNRSTALATPQGLPESRRARSRRSRQRHCQAGA